jgi:hypothetical protein
MTERKRAPLLSDAIEQKAILDKEIIPSLRRGFESALQS